MTFRKLAELAGVSPATVSKALSGSSEISTETADRIFRIAAENGMDIVKRKTLHINPDTVRVAVLVPELISIFYAQIVTDLCAGLTAAGIEHSIRICGFDDTQIQCMVDTIVQEEIFDGILSLIGFTADPNTPIPIMIFGAEGPYCDSISVDIESGMNEAIRHLKALGHTEIGMISERYTGAKLRAFQNSMVINDLTVNNDFIWISNKRFEAIGYEAVQSMLSNRRLPTALIAAYDEIALGAIHALQAHGIRIPEDISVIGINDIPFSAYSSTPLTTLQSYLRQTCETALKVLIEKIQNGNEGMRQHIKVKSRLIVRETTAPVRTANPIPKE